VLYGCEPWAMTEKMKPSVKTWHQKILRKIHGPVKHQNGWRIQIKNELQVRYRKPNNITTIKVTRLEWAGHLVRMSVNRTVIKVFLRKPDGRRKAGRPKLRWSD
jgi:hypothetical protein